MDVNTLRTLADNHYASWIGSFPGCLFLGGELADHGIPGEGVGVNTGVRPLVSHNFESLGVISPRHVASA